MIQITINDYIFYVPFEFFLFWAMEIVTVQYGQHFFQVLTRDFVLLGALENASISGLELLI